MFSILTTWYTLFLFHYDKRRNCSSGAISPLSQGYEYFWTIIFFFHINLFNISPSCLKCLLKKKTYDWRHEKKGLSHICQTHLGATVHDSTVVERRTGICEVPGSNPRRRASLSDETLNRGPSLKMT